MNHDGSSTCYYKNLWHSQVIQALGQGKTLKEDPAPHLAFLQKTLNQYHQACRPGIQAVCDILVAEGYVQ